MHSIKQKHAAFSSGRMAKEIVYTSIACLFASLAVGFMLLVVGYVCYKGMNGLSISMFAELPPPPGSLTGGFGNALLGTLTMVGIATIISAPLSILSAVYLSELAKNNWLNASIRFAIEILNGVPSIIIGLFAYSVVVIATGTFSAIAGSFALALVMLPVMVLSSEEALKSVPQEMRQSALALGATRWQTTLKIVIPKAVPSIFTGVMLSVARGAGETAPLIFTALFSQYWLSNLTSPAPSLSVLIYNFATSPFENQQNLAWAAAFVLICLVLIVNVTIRVATSRSKDK